jgi:myosin heavy subunit
MWWKRFIGSPLGISALPRDKLEHLCIVSSEQLGKMQGQAKALSSEVHDLSVETTRQLFLLQQSTMDVMHRGSDEVCPPPYSASERRAGQLRGKIAQIMADMDKVDEEIAANSEVLGQYIESHQVDPRIPRDSLLVGPFNNTDLRKIYTELSILAATTGTEADRDDFTFCLDILSGESRLLGRRIEEMRQQFNRGCIDKQEELDALIAEALRVQKCVRKLEDQMDLLSQKAEQLRPVLPSVRKRLQQDIKSLSSTDVEFAEVGEEIKSLRANKDQYKQRVAALRAELLAKPIHDVDRNAEIEQSIQLRQEKTELNIELHEKTQQKLCQESTIKSLEEAIEVSEQQKKVLLEQCDTIRRVSDAHRTQLNMLKQAQLAAQDLPAVIRWSHQILPDELDKSVEEIRERIKLMEKRGSTLERRIQQLIEQDRDYQDQIGRLEELLAAARMGMAEAENPLFE